MFVEVAVAIRSPKSFHYSVPGDLDADIAVGKRVLVPFGKRTVTGYVLQCQESIDREETREIIELLDPEPLFNEEDLRFYRWASDYYVYPLGKMLGEVLPGGIDVENCLWLSIGEEGSGPAPLRLSPGQLGILDVLKKSPSGLSLKQLRRKIGKKPSAADLEALRGMGYVHLDERMTKPRISAKKEAVLSVCPPGGPAARLTEKQRRAVDFVTGRSGVTAADLSKVFKDTSKLIRDLQRKGVVRIEEREVFRNPQRPSGIHQPAADLCLSREQESAMAEIREGILSGRFCPYLLHGVTGSGKTEVYFNAIAEALKQGSSVIYLVPEIALTPQLQSRIIERFGTEDVAVLHSGVPGGARYDQWRRIQRGELRIIVGARSALFAPARHLKLIIVDEEHDGSYKQDERMPYNARDLAVLRARLNSAAVVLGSATPGIQTYFNTAEKQFRRLTLPKRVEEKPLPDVSVVDMKQERDKTGKIPVLSAALLSALDETLKAGKQALILLNRRGFTTFISCTDCAHVFQCPGCSVSLTHHMRDDSLKCHYCDYTIQVPGTCPSCSGKNLARFGAGTEKLEEEVRRHFPGARVGRMDSDTTARKGSYEKILKALHEGRLDILVGTQMIAKGHDFPNVTLVGVVSADTSLNIPDFRASEKTFQLLTQVSGRGGRGDTPGRVVIQTLNPLHYAVSRAKNHDYEGFYAEELSIRRDAGYPPFTRMVQLLISGLNGPKVEEQARRLSEFAARRIRSGEVGPGVAVIGPAEAPIARIKGRHRWQMLIRGLNVRGIQRLTRELLSEARVPGCEVKVDVDPMNFL